MGIGVVLCISPRNFPLSIFLGQVVAALECGNYVIAKPAEQTSLIAAQAIQLCHDIGVPKNVLHLLPGKDEIVGEELFKDLRIKSVIFTGSYDVCKRINKLLSMREGAIIFFIAETSGINAMIVDSTALREQVIDDVISSAFGNAGQRCTSLRLLYIQEECYDSTLHGIVGAMKELTVGDPRFIETDIGPIIDREALTILKNVPGGNEKKKLSYI